MFPIDDGSLPEWNIKSESDVAELRGDAEWWAGYKEAVELCVGAWGWDVAAARRYSPPAETQGWTGWDVRLAKIVRSLWLFEAPHFESVQQFAHVLQRDEKRGASFRYGGINLDEILHMRLPRRAAPPPPPGAGTTAKPGTYTPAKTVELMKQRGKKLKTVPTGQVPPPASAGAATAAVEKAEAPQKAEAASVADEKPKAVPEAAELEKFSGESADEAAADPLKMAQPQGAPTCGQKRALDEA